MKYKQNGEWVDVPPTLETLERQLVDLKHIVRRVEECALFQYQKAEAHKESRKGLFKAIAVTILTVAVITLAYIGLRAITSGFITY